MKQQLGLYTVQCCQIQTADMLVVLSSFTLLRTIIRSPTEPEEKRREEKSVFDSWSDIVGL